MKPLAALAFFLLAAAPPPGTIQIDRRTLVWNQGPATMSQGTEVAVLEGDPKAKGPFTIRLRIPAGTRIAPHWHPRPERVTVLSGEVFVGFGDTWDDASVRAFHAGDFYINPANSHHYVAFPQASVIQITGEGPWELHPLH
jgi:quercetin dioxygenase-like cupin family protein